MLFILQVIMHPVLYFLIGTCVCTGRLSAHVSFQTVHNITFPIGGGAIYGCKCSPGCGRSSINEQDMEQQERKRLQDEQDMLPVEQERLHDEQDRLNDEHDRLHDRQYKLHDELDWL